MKTIQVNVTANDIALGIEDDCHYCPVARAIARATGLKCDQVAVCTEQIDFMDCKPLESAGTPDKVGNFICEFDGDGALSVQPFNFELTIYETADL